MATNRAAQPSTGELLEAVSNLVVRVYADRVGRGPTKARAYADRDIIVCVMEDTMTKAERTLVEAGHGGAVKQARDALRETMDADLAKGIEGVTGCRVVAQTGSSTLEPDITSDLFILDGQEAASAAVDSTHTRTGVTAIAGGNRRPAGRNRHRVV